MTTEEIKTAVKEALKEHHSCYFNESDRQLLKDLIYGARTLKRAVIWCVVVALLAGIGIKYLPSFKG